MRALDRKFKYYMLMNKLFSRGRTLVRWDRHSLITQFLRYCTMSDGIECCVLSCYQNEKMKITYSSDWELNPQPSLLQLNALVILFSFWNIKHVTIARFKVKNDTIYVGRWKDEYITSITKSIKWYRTHKIYVQYIIGYKITVLL